jgi:hypothetical protein
MCVCVTSDTGLPHMSTQCQLNRNETDMRFVFACACVQTLAPMVDPSSVVAASLLPLGKTVRAKIHCLGPLRLSGLDRFGDFGVRITIAYYL